MTQLQVTYSAAVAGEALAFARDWIARAREPDGIFHPNATRVYGTEAMKSWARWSFGAEGSSGSDDVLYFAQNANKEADLALRELIAEYTDRGEPLPAVLNVYNKRLINPWRKPKRSGPGPAENF